MPTSTTSKSRIPLHPVIILWIGILFASTVAIFIRCSTAPVMVLAAYRKTIVTLLILPYVFLHHREELFSLDRKTVLWCLLSGTFLAFHFITYFMSIEYTTIAASQVLAGTEVLFVAAFMFFSGSERYSKISTLGIFVALSGSILVSFVQGGSAGSSTAALGNACAVFCALMMAAYSLIGTNVRKHCSTTVYTFLVYGTSAIVLNILVGVRGYAYTGYGAINYLLALGMAITGSLLGHSIFNWSLKYLSPTFVSMCKIFQPVISVIWGLLFFMEIPAWNQILGGAVVIGGIFLYIKFKSQ